MINLETAVASAFERMGYELVAEHSFKKTVKGKPLKYYELIGGGERRFLHVQNRQWPTHRERIAFREEMFGVADEFLLLRGEEQIIYEFRSDFIRSLCDRDGLRPNAKNGQIQFYLRSDQDWLETPSGGELVSRFRKQ